MRFNDILNKYLIDYNSQPLEGIIYEQYNIVEKKGFFYILDRKQNRIIGSGKTVSEVKEKINSIISGC